MRRMEGVEMMTDHEIEEFEIWLAEQKEEMREEQKARNYEFWSDYCEKYYAEVGGNDD